MFDPTLQAVLFDLDGTLIDSAPDLGAAADQMRLARGLPSLPYERYRPMAGAGARGMLGEAFGVTPDHPDFAALREEFFQNYESRLTQATAHPAHAFLADDYSLLNADPQFWQHLLGHRQITDCYLLGLAVRHQCRFVSFDARLNLQAVPGARAEHLVTL